MNSKPTYFDIERDKISSYFCQACLVGKVESEMDAAHYTLFGRTSRVYFLSFRSILTRTALS